MFIEIKGVSKYFQLPSQQDAAKVAAIKDFDISIEAGRMLALVGSSGSGKTTLLRCIAGLETPDDGTISINGRAVYSSAQGVNVPPEQRNLGLIFQSYALWPNMTVKRNVAYPLQRRRLPEAECKTRIEKYLTLVGCEHLAERYPHELSGGQQQRIALARALVYEPSVILFDEPLSNLDANLREHLRISIRTIQRQLGITGVYVTHDQAEAFYLGDEVALMSHGRLIQAGTPEDMYRRPNQAEVAKFTGAVNQSTGRLDEGGLVFQSDDLGRVPLRERPDLEGASGRPVLLMIRPDSVHLRPPGGDTATATVINQATTGAYDEYVVELKSGDTWRTRSGDGSPRFEVGQQVALDLVPAGIFLFPDDRPASKTDES